MTTKYTHEILQSLVAESKCFSDVTRKLGLRQSGGNHSHIKKMILKFEIDTSHFKKSTEYLRPGVNKRTPDQILVLKETGNREGASRLRRAMIESNIEYKCASCGQGDQWNGDVLVLEVHHKNGNWLDNRLGNLEFMCPNCHSQR